MSVTYASWCAHNLFDPHQHTLESQILTKINLLLPIMLKVIAEVIIDPLVALCFALGRLTSPTSIPKQTLGAQFLHFL